MQKLTVFRAKIPVALSHGKDRILSYLGFFKKNTIKGTLLKHDFRSGHFT